MQMTMKMIRSFNPVGQGAFYTEQFLIGDKIYNFVFDCGSSTGKDVLKKEIDLNFKQNEEIEAVFISHCHDDHINGLDTLLKKCKVKKLFLPLIKEENKVLLLMKSYIDFGYNSESLLTKLISNPYSLVDDGNYHINQVILVKEMSEDGESEEIENETIVLNGDTISREINSGHPLILKHLNKRIWMYKLTNFKENVRISELKDAFKAEQIEFPKTPSETLDVWEKNKKKIKDIYSQKSSIKITGGINTNSLVVFSGQANSGIDMILHAHFNINPISCFYRCDFCRRNFHERQSFGKSGCMYMGDYEAKGRDKWRWIEDTYHKQWNDIDIWQLPHHGSSRNFNNELAYHDARFYIACAGFTNRHRHPGASVIKKLFMNNKIIHCVDEHESTRLKFIYYF